MADLNSHEGLLEGMISAAQEAGDIAMRFFRDGAVSSAEVQYKEGGSPVSEADLAADALLRTRLLGLIEDAGWLSEETADSPARLERRRVFIVDPIDGTRAFIKGDPRWGVSVALVEDGRPTLGVLRMPALGDTFAAIDGRGAQLNGSSISVSGRNELRGARFAGPIKAMDALDQQGFAVAREPRIPSLAYRLARIASGDLDAAVASTNAWDWDIAAAHLLIREAGGRLTDLDMNEPVYNAAEPRHRALTAAAPQLHGELVAAIRRISAE